MHKNKELIRLKASCHGVKCTNYNYFVFIAAFKTVWDVPTNDFGRFNYDVICPSDFD